MKILKGDLLKDYVGKKIYAFDIALMLYQDEKGYFVTHRGLSYRVDEVRGAINIRECTEKHLGMCAVLFDGPDQQFIYYKEWAYGKEAPFATIQAKDLEIEDLKNQLAELKNLITPEPSVLIANPIAPSIEFHNPLMEVIKLMIEADVRKHEISINGK